jgi:signal transduction histidine kinase
MHAGLWLAGAQWSFPVFSGRNGGGAVDAGRGIGLLGNLDQKPCQDSSILMSSTLMSEPAGNLVWLSHPRLAAAAMSALPAWLWSTDASRLLWANPSGAAIFDAPTSAAIRASALGSRGPAAIQVARLAATLQPEGAPRLERLHGLGAGVGGVLTCACSCITLSDHTRAILVAATERAGSDLPLAERVRRLLANCSEPIAAFSAEGMLIHASPAAAMRLGGTTSLAALGAEMRAADARGRATGASAAGPLTVERVEAEAATILIATFGTPRPVAPAAPVTAEPAATTGRRAPLRFVWRMDAEHRFTVDSDAFVTLMGPATAAALDRPWPELAAGLALDPQGQIALALASRDTWSGLSVAWPVDGGPERLMVELSGLPVFDRERNFCGYRGFGVCRDVGSRAGAPGARQAATAEAAAATPAGENVVPLRPTAPPVVPALSPVERSAFHELTRKLQERLTAAGSPPPLPAAAGPHAQAGEAATGSPQKTSQETSQETTQDASRAASADRLPRPPAPELDAAELRAALERAQAEILEVKAAKRQAEKASSVKSEFLAKISHEIRTPLNAIIGFSEIMAQEKFGPVGNERYRQYLVDIQSSGGHLLSLVNDLLDLSKIEAGKLELDFAGVALNPLTQQCVAIMQPQANRERIIIRTSLSPRLPPVIADARSVRQIVLNLISNSTKFTGAGGQVIVSTTLTDLGGVVLRVRDSGVGMSEKEIALALEPFRQVATTVRAGPPGTGLGLPLTKALAEANRATFSIKSAPDAGTLIEVAFPPNRVLAEERR